MSKSLMAVITSLVAAAIILVSVGAARERHAAAADNRPAPALAPAIVKTAKPAPDDPSPSPPKSASKDATKSAPDDMAGDDIPKVIRLVRDPAPAPPFLLNDLDGNAISTAEFHGKVVIVNFWATWCPPCREEIPEMIALANKYKDSLQIIGVSRDDAPPEEVREFTHDENMNYPVVMGSDELAEEYGGIPALPTSFVLDTNGRVVQKHVGLYPPEVYDGEIRALLGLHVNKPVETFADTGQIFLKNASSFPGVDFKGLTPDQKKLALKRMNSELCTCGCNLTIAQCLMSDTSCATSQALAKRIVRQIRTGEKPAPPAPAVPQTSAQNE
jgi:thiol-disulfide isomerase/thioredoxin